MVVLPIQMFQRLQIIFEHICSSSCSVWSASVQPCGPGLITGMSRSEKPIHAAANYHIFSTCFYIKRSWFLEAALQNKIRFFVVPPPPISYQLYFPQPLLHIHWWCNILMIVNILQNIYLIIVRIWYGHDCYCLEQVITSKIKWKTD